MGLHDHHGRESGWERGAARRAEILPRGHRRTTLGIVISLLLTMLLVAADPASAGPGKPSNTAKPSISGVPAQGQVLTADPGTWSGVQPITYTYQWQRCDASGAGCSTTKGTTQTYTLSPSEVGFTMRVKVTARNSAGQNSATSSPTAVIQGTPVNTSPPTISGVAREGSQLTTDTGTWSGKPTTYAYRWQRCDALQGCLDIFGATDPVYRATSLDVDDTLRVVVTAANAVGETSATSAQTAAVLPAAPLNTAPPTISGTPQDAQTITADPGTWSSSRPLTYAYQWTRCDSAGAGCSNISGATASAYSLTSADVGSTLRVAVTATNSGGSGSATSSPTAVIAAAPPSSTTRPSISGTAHQASTLNADSGGWSGTTPMDFAYQWLRCDADGGACTELDGATNSTYTPVAGDVGGTLRIIVTASNAAGSASATSDPTGVVGPPVTLENSEPPSISGVAQTGQTLTADPGTWSGSDPITYAYQWQRCDASGAACVNLAGSTSATYHPVVDDVGSTLRVVVTASDASGSTSAVSAATPVVTGPPANSSAPSIAGTPQQGLTLTADPGAWSGSQPIAYAYQWRRCDGGGANCTTISGATARTYTPVSADVGATMRVLVTGTNSAGTGSATSTFTSTVTAAGSIGYRGQSFSGAGTAPTGSKPESKLWFNDGAWWASMWAGSGKGFHIFRLDRATQRWIDTGVQLDDRAGTRADALWDGRHLYVASHVFSSCGCSTSSTGSPSRLYRYTYDATADTYSLDAGFPVQLNNTKTETLVIDRDTTGTLWATWAQDSKVMVTHSQGGDDRSWVTPYVMPLSGAANLSTDDISSLVAYGPGYVGVMWSNQNDSAMYFAVHTDGSADATWSLEPAVKSPLYADDHMNLKSLQTDGSGRVFAITKTSLNDAANPDSNAPIVLLLQRTSGGRWAQSPVWRVGDGVTRPILVIDESNGVLHAFATSSEAGGVIREKTSPISTIGFPTGSGTTFLKDASSNAINNATTSKQNGTRASGLALLASNDSTGYYWHNVEAIP